MRHGETFLLLLLLLLLLFFERPHQGLARLSRLEDKISLSLSLSRCGARQQQQSARARVVFTEESSLYVCVCDESNNTPSRIDRNELYLDIAIEPVKAVEFIYIPLRLKNTGEIAGL